MPKVTQMPASPLPLPPPSPASAYQIFELKCVAKLKQTTAGKGGEGECGVKRDGVRPNGSSKTAETVAKKQKAQKQTKKIKVCDAMLQFDKRWAH